MSLSVSRLVKVSVVLSPLAAAGRSFGVLMVAGDSDVISGLERFRTYLTIEGVAADFGVEAPEYKAAALYFSQKPQPKTLMIGRWIRTASHAENLGGIQSPSELALENWTAISNGGFVISIDGSVHTLTGLDFTGATNLNGVASIITAALAGSGTCQFTGSDFVIISNSSGAGSAASGSITLSSNPSYGVQASGTITLSGQPTNGDTVTIKGTVVTFVSGTPSGNQVQISVVDDLGTAANLQAFLQASSDVNLAALTYITIGLVTTMTARVYGTAGNAYTLAKSGVNIAISAGTLAGGVAADTLTIGGTAITFVANAPSGNQVLVGPTAAATAGNLQVFLSASVDANISLCFYSLSGLVISLVYKTLGVAGNSFTIAKSSTHISLSGATLSGGLVPSSVGYATAGSGTDISAKLKLTASLAISLVPGYDAESPVECAAIMANKSAAWYGLMFAASVQPTDSQSLEVSAFIEPLDLTRMYGVTIQDANTESALVTTDLASLMKAAGYDQSFNQFSSSSAYAVASIFGRAFSVDFNAANSTITLMYKQEPGVVPEVLDENTANVLQAKRCNVYASYNNDTQIIQYGVMSGEAYIDEIHGLDWFQNALQTALFNLLYTSTTKIPQTDAGSNQLTTAASGVCAQAVNNGLAGPGTWNGPSFGALNTGDYLKNGYYVFIQPMALQSQADRDARKAPPIQVALKLAGAIQEVDVLVTVNR